MIFWNTYMGSFVLVLSLFMWAAPTAHAAVPAVYTNDNYWESEHDRPVFFVQDALGNFSGYTETGKYFTQTKITNEHNIRLHRFAIDEAYFYISSRGIIVAENDTAALSIYLTRQG